MVDDSSTDNTLQEVSDFIAGDNRFSVISNKKKKGAPGARNTGVEKATGDYLIFLDSDDLLTKDCLENRLNKFQSHPKNDFLVFSTLEFKKEPGDTNVLINVSTNEDIICRFLNLDIPWLTTGPIWKRESFLQSGMWNEEMLSWQDWELHLRVLLKKYKFLHFSEIDNYWRFDGNLGSTGKMSIGIDHRLSVLKAATGMAEQVKDNPTYLKRLNGLIYWIAEKLLEDGHRRQALEVLKLSAKHRPAVEKIINLISSKIENKFIIRDLHAPNYGSLRKVCVNNYR